MEPLKDLGPAIRATLYTGAVHKVDYVTLEGEGVQESVTVCDRREGVKRM